MKWYRLLLSLALVVTGITGLVLPARAADFTSSCKWPYPWPHTVYYYVDPSSFGTHTDRVMYGASTWTEENFNLILSRNYTNSPYYVATGPVSPNQIAVTTITFSLTSSCVNNPSPNPYWTIYSAKTIFNQNDLFYYDCLAAGQSWCVSNNYYDLHNIAAHEFGHWFHLLDTYASSDNLDTMYGYSYTGEVQPRTPTAHDLDEAWIMYGCRNGGLTFYC